MRETKKTTQPVQTPYGNPEGGWTFAKPVRLGGRGIAEIGIGQGVCLSVQFDDSLGVPLPNSPLYSL
jgi:hypothetical protein